MRMRPSILNSEKDFQLVFSPYFKLTLSRLKHFLSRKYTPELASKTIQTIRRGILNRFPDNPYVGPLSDRLVDLGVSGYRQLVVDEHNIVIYRVDEQNHQIFVLLVFDSRQSLRKLLSEVMLVI